MNRIRRAIAVFLDSWLADLERQVAESRAGITVVEAVASQLTDTDLLAVCSNPAQVAEVKQLALELAKLGLTLDDLPKLTAAYTAINYQRALTADDIRDVGHLIARAQQRSTP